MQEAGIQFWLLTGDKMATAKNIARSCGLFPNNCDIHVIEEKEDVQIAYETVMQRQSIRPSCLVLTAKSLTLIKDLMPKRKKRRCYLFFSRVSELPSQLLFLIEQ